MLALLPARAGAQPGGDTVAVLAEVHRRMVEKGPTVGPETWPGFRPDTVPVAFVARGRGVLLTGWKEAPPEGFAPVERVPGAAWRAEEARGAASTGAELGGRRVAQVVVDTLDPAALLGVAAHEAFHVFQGAGRRPERRFGRGENSVLVSEYPALDVENEAALALEAALLREALAAAPERTRTAARAWLAAREARHRRMPAEMAEFEAMAELNEGLAEYALLRMRAADGAERVTGGVPEGLMTRVERAPEAASPRLRFYATGAALAYLLDRLAGPGWKAATVDGDLTLQEALARAAGARDEEDALLRSAAARLGGDSLRARTERRVERARAGRLAQVDGARSLPGVLLRIRADSVGGAFGLCGFDPQNMLRVSPSLVLHTRWLRPCAGGALEAELTARVVDDRAAGTLEAVIGAADEVRMTAGGEPLRLGDGERGTVAALRIESPAVALSSPKAVVERRGREVTVTPLR